MSIIRFGMERADGGESQIYAYFNAGGKGSIHIGRKPEDHYPQGPREWTGDIIIPPDDFSELVARLLERAGYEDVTGVRDALDEVYEEVRDHERELQEQQTDPRSVVLSDEGRNTIARLWFDGEITTDEAEELAGEDGFKEIKQARDAVEDDVEWALETGTSGRKDWTNSTPTDTGESLFGDLTDTDRATIADLWDQGEMTDDAARELLGHDAFEDLRGKTEGAEQILSGDTSRFLSDRDDQWDDMHDLGQEPLPDRDESDVNEQVEAEWVEDTMPFERVRSVMKHAYEPQSVGDIAERARTSKESTRKYLRYLTEEGFVLEASTRERSGALYRRSPESLILEQAQHILGEVDDDALLTCIAEIQSEIRQYNEESGAESPEDAVLQDQPLEERTLQDWQTTRRNLGFAKVALALKETKAAIDEDTRYE